MTGRMEKTVIISYRRTNLPWALAIYQNLHHNGYDVFFDYLSIDSGNFEKVIIENIKTRAHFVVILTPSALERCNEPGDWLRREIETAMDENRNIIPMMLESFDFGSTSVVQALTGKLSKLNKYNGLRVPSEYFLEAMDRLRDRYLNMIVGDIALPSLDIEANQITETQKSAASEAPLVEKEQLTAQEWFERGYVFADDKNFDEAIRCFSEAIQLKSDFTEAYLRRGSAYGAKKDSPLAIEDFTKAIQLSPKYDLTYAGRGLALNDLGDFDSAIADFTKAIELNPNRALLYIFRSSARQTKGELDDALKDCDEAIGLAPALPFAYNIRGTLLRVKGDLDGAIQDYTHSIELNDRDLFTPHYFRGLIYHTKGEKRNALADYNEAIRLKPDFSMAYYNRGLIWEKKRNYSSAIADFQQYLALSGGVRQEAKRATIDKIKKLKSKVTNQKKSVKKKTK